MNAKYVKNESAISIEQKPALTLVENLPEIARIPCKKRKSGIKEMTYVILEEDQVTELEREYAELKLYEAILEALGKTSILTADEIQGCRERNQQRMRMKEIENEEL